MYGLLPDGGPTNAKEERHTTEEIDSKLRQVDVLTS
jgi:hypothetical protein